MSNTYRIESAGTWKIAHSLALTPPVHELVFVEAILLLLMTGARHIPSKPLFNATAYYLGNESGELWHKDVFFFRLN